MKDIELEKLLAQVEIQRKLEKREEKKRKKEVKLSPIQVITPANTQSIEVKYKTKELELTKKQLELAQKEQNLKAKELEQKASELQKKEAEIEKNKELTEREKKLELANLKAEIENNAQQKAEEKARELIEAERLRANRQLEKILKDKAKLETDIKKLEDEKLAAEHKAEEERKAREDAFALAEKIKNEKEEILAQAESELAKATLMANTSSEEAKSRIAELERLVEKARSEKQVAESNANAERLAKQQAEEKAAEERKAREEAEERAKKEIATKLEAERIARLDAERIAEAERKARTDIEQSANNEFNAKLEKERFAREEAERKAEEERKARKEAEKKAEAERKAREAAETKAQAVVDKIQTEANIRIEEEKSAILAKISNEKIKEEAKATAALKSEERKAEKEAKRKSKEEKKAKRREKASAETAETPQTPPKASKSTNTTTKVSKSLKSQNTQSEEANWSYIQDYLPIEDVQYGIIKLKNGDFVKILEISAVNFTLMDNIKKKQLLAAYEGFVKNFPEEIQFKSISVTTDISQLMANIEAANTEYVSEEYQERLEDYKNIIIQNKGAKPAHRYFIIYKDKKSKNFKDSLEKMMDFRVIAENLLQSCFLRVLNPDSIEKDNTFTLKLLHLLFNRRTYAKDTYIERFKRLYDDIAQVNLTDDFGIIKENLKPIDLICGRQLFFKKDYYMADGLFCIPVILPSYGHREYIYPSWMESLTQAAPYVDVDMIAVKEPHDEVLNELKLQIRFDKSTARSSESQDKVEKAEQKINNNAYIRQEMKQGGDLFRTVIVLSFWGTNLRELRNMVDIIIRSYRSQNGIVMRIPKGRIHEIYNLTLPVCDTNNTLFKYNYRNYLTSSMVASFMFTAASFYTSKGVFFGTINNSLAVINRFSKVYNNGNMLITGITGSGKTFELMQIGSHMRLMNQQVLAIIPVKAFEYYPNVKSLGGEFIKLAPSAQTCINIMEIRYYEDPDAEFLEEGLKKQSRLANKIKSVTAFCNLMMGNKPMNTVTKLALMDHLNTLYGKFGITNDDESIYNEDGTIKKMPIISDLYNELEGDKRFDELRIVLTPFINGICSNLNGQTNINLNNKLVVFDVEDAPEDFLAAFMYIAFDFCYDVVKKDKTTYKNIILDELWKLLINPVAADYILELCKLVRSYGASTIIGTQSINDLLKAKENNVGEEIINASMFKLFLKVDRVSVPNLKRLFNFTDEELLPLIESSNNDNDDDDAKKESNNVGNAILDVNGEHIKIKLIASEMEKDIFSTRVEDRLARLERLKKEKTQKQ